MLFISLDIPNPLPSASLYYISSRIVFCDDLAHLNIATVVFLPYNTPLGPMTATVSFQHVCCIGQEI